MVKQDLEFVVWDKGKPVASTPKEAKRLNKRLQIIDKVLKEMGYKEGTQKYQEIMSKMAKEDFQKYMKFLARVDELAKKEGC